MSVCECYNKSQSTNYKLNNVSCRVCGEYSVLNKKTKCGQSLNVCSICDNLVDCKCLICTTDPVIMTNKKCKSCGESFRAKKIFKNGRNKTVFLKHNNCVDGGKLDVKLEEIEQLDLPMVDDKLLQEYKLIRFFDPARGGR